MQWHLNASLQVATLALYSGISHQSTPYLPELCWISKGSEVKVNLKVL